MRNFEPGRSSVTTASEANRFQEWNPTEVDNEEFEAEEGLVGTD